MACRMRPYPEFVRELGYIFTNPFEIDWDHESGQFRLFEIAKGKSYLVLGYYPFEQHRGTLRLLQMNNLWNEDNWARVQAKSLQRRLEMDRKYRSTTNEAKERVAEIAHASSFAKSAGSGKAQDKSWGEGFVKDIERDG